MALCHPSNGRPRVKKKTSDGRRQSAVAFRMKARGPPLRHGPPNFGQHHRKRERPRNEKKGRARPYLRVVCFLRAFDTIASDKQLKFPSVIPALPSHVASAIGQTDKEHFSRQDTSLYLGRRSPAARSSDGRAKRKPSRKTCRATLLCGRKPKWRCISASPAAI